ncbi:hypothetical protein [Planomonospora venezuelensis]|uniref:Minor capsid protein n=1 Tax=Planomonospora venezuelensis TaxID=1999 RepID=A0A841DAA2_PLAVE|nr:hypothetical protein [Planomonospora venezuelensis]MBB5965055.1 hypothetical protein [Planomonospora venezuelensis]GIN05028.1 hypothetical protein Pve01_66860 [Planomonospora venezuelensis]
MPQRAVYRSNVGKIKAKQRAAAVLGLRKAAEHLLKASRDLVPIEEATLERSGVASVDEGALRAAVSYDTPYAVRQHEELTWRHDPGRQAKYLEQPMTDEASTMGELVAAELRRALR